MKVRGCRRAAVIPAMLRRRRTFIGGHSWGGYVCYIAVTEAQRKIDNEECRAGRTRTNRQEAQHRMIVNEVLIELTLVNV